VKQRIHACKAIRSLLKQVKSLPKPRTLDNKQQIILKPQQK